MRLYEFYKKIDEVVQIPHSRFIEGIKIALQSGQIPYVWGQPGIGKTEMIRQAAKELGWKLFPLDLDNKEPEDLIGTPHKVIDKQTGETTVKYIPDPDIKEIIDFAESNPETNVLLFLDELNNAQEQVLRIAYKLVLEKRIGRLNLPDNIHLIAAGNPSTVRGGRIIPQALQQRFYNIYLNVEPDAWLKFAKENKYNPSIIEFIQNNPKLLHDKPKDDDDQLTILGTQVYAYPRGWGAISKALNMIEHSGRSAKQLLSNDILAYISDICIGNIGEKVGKEFFKFYVQHLRSRLQPTKSVGQPDNSNSNVYVNDIVGRGNMNIRMGDHNSVINDLFIPALRQINSLSNTNAYKPLANLFNYTVKMNDNFLIKTLENLLVHEFNNILSTKIKNQPLEYQDQSYHDMQMAYNKLVRLR